MVLIIFSTKGWVFFEQFLEKLGLSQNSRSIGLQCKLYPEKRFAGCVEGDLVVLPHARYECVHVFRFVTEDICVVDE